MRKVARSLALVITNLLGLGVVVAMMKRQEIDALVLVPVTVVLVLLIVWVRKQRTSRDDYR